MKLNCNKNKNILWSSDHGFTLVEIMVATAVSIMIISSVYAAFRSSLTAYEHNQARIIMLQKCRMSLDRMARDFNNLFYVEDDEELILLVQDYADTELNVDQDMISFATIVNPKLSTYLQAQELIESGASSSESEDTEESENPLPSDLARVTYFISRSVENENMQSLYRIETTELDAQELETLLSDIQSSNSSDEIQDTLRSSVLIDNIGGFNIRYFDGEDWVDTWDMEEDGGLPKAVELTLTIPDENNKEKPITQAVVVYLPFSASQEQQGSQTP